MLNLVITTCSRLEYLEYVVEGAPTFRAESTKRLMPMNTRLLIAFTASLFLVACGDDGDDGGTDAGGTYMCVAPYASLNNEQFAAAAGTGMCANASDLELACSVDMPTIVGVCGVSCYQANPSSTEEQLAACTGQCVLENPATVTDPSQGCLGCYLQSVGCTLQNCLNECAGGSTTPGCVSCRADNGCTSAFYTCSGLPTPPT